MHNYYIKIVNDEVANNAISAYCSFLIHHSNLITMDDMSVSVGVLLDKFIQCQSQDTSVAV